MTKKQAELIVQNEIERLMANSNAPSFYLASQIIKVLKKAGFKIPKDN